MDAQGYQGRLWDNYISKIEISEFRDNLIVMKSSKRDLLVLSKNVSIDKKEMELQVERLHDLLFHVESFDNFCIANEIIDINRYKIIQNPAKIRRIISQNKMKPFQFINNKN